MWRRFLVIGSALIVLGFGWHLFRPELLFVDQNVNESFPEEASQEESDLLASGSFHGIAHDGAGTAAVYQLSDGSRTLRLTEFQTSNGPDLRVYLVAAPDATDSETVARSDYVDLGVLKGNTGNQNYDVPEGVDLDEYRSVSIWCRRFSVNFATAPLRPGD